MGVIGTNPGPKETHKQTIFHNHSSREIEGDRMENEMDKARVVKDIKMFQAVCQDNHKCTEGVPKDCKEAIRILSTLYDDVVEFEHNDTYTAVVEQIARMLKECSGNDSMGYCGTALIEATQFLHRQPDDLTKNPVTREDFLEFLNGRQELTDIEPCSAKVKPITYEVQNGYVPGKDTHMMLYHE